MSTDKLTTLFAALTSLSAVFAGVAQAYGQLHVAVGLGAFAAALHAVNGYFTNKP